MSNKELKREVMGLRSSIKIQVEKEKRYIEQADKISKVKFKHHFDLEFHLMRRENEINS